MDFPLINFNAFGKINVLKYNTVMHNSEKNLVN